MTNIKSNLVRKKIGEKHHRGFEFEPNQKLIYKIVTTSEYKTNGEELILVKQTPHCKLTLDSDTTNYIIIKALTKVTIITNKNYIDEFYNEMVIDKGACVELYNLEGSWYILSSDGLKLS
jgi:hypothetical protein